MQFLSDSTVRLLRDLYADLARRALPGPLHPGAVEPAALQARLFGQMERTGRQRAGATGTHLGFWPGLAWSLGHFLHTSHLDMSRASGSGRADPRDHVHGALESSIQRVTGQSLLHLKREFVEQAESMVGPGWVWLVRPWPIPSPGAPAPVAPTLQSMPAMQPGLGTRVVQSPGAFPPIYLGNATADRGIMHDQPGSICTPILGCDLWEHAYWRDYGMDRIRYVEAWWTAIRWETVLPLLAVTSCKLANVQLKSRNGVNATGIMPRPRDTMGSCNRERNKHTAGESELGPASAIASESE